MNILKFELVVLDVLMKLNSIVLPVLIFNVLKWFPDAYEC